MKTRVVSNDDGTMLPSTEQLGIGYTMRIEAHQRGVHVYAPADTEHPIAEIGAGEYATFEVKITNYSGREQFKMWAPVFGGRGFLEGRNPVDNELAARCKAKVAELWPPPEKEPEPYKREYLAAWVVNGVDGA